MIFTEFILDFSDQEISPLDHHVLGNSSMMRLLNFIKVLKLSWKFQNILASVHESLFVKVNALLNEDSSNCN